MKPLPFDPVHITADHRFEKGCDCISECDNAPKGNVCAYWIAKTKGPITFKQCNNCTLNDKKKQEIWTFHDKDSNCLRCDTTVVLTEKGQKILENKGEQK